MFRHNINLCFRTQSPSILHQSRLIRSFSAKEVNQQMNEETLSGASEPKESEDDTEIKSTVKETMVINVDSTSEDTTNANARVAPIGVDSSSTAAAFSSIKVRPPAPFLLKVYDMVHDPETDSIITWNNEGTSFIVMDQHKFAAEVLKKYFRHNNFTSFICQLNTYCFKKISWDRWEFQNEWFRRGEKLLLKNIRRRNQNFHNLQQRSFPTVDWDESELTNEFEDLRQEHDALVAEVKEQQAWHQSASEQFSVLKKQIQCSASKRKKMVNFMAQMVWMLKKRMHGAEVAKKRRLEWPETESLTEVKDAGETSNENDKEYWPTAQSDKQDMFLTVGSGTPNGEKGIPDIRSAEFELLEKQLMEDINSVNVPKEEITKLQSGVMIELEDLIQGPADWMEYTKELIGNAKNLKTDS